MKKVVKCVSNKQLADWDREITHKETRDEIRFEIRRRARKNKNKKNG